KKKKKIPASFTDSEFVEINFIFSWCLFVSSVVSLEKSLQSLGTSRDTAELRQSLHSTQQQTNKVITSTSQLIKQLSDIISGSSRQDRLRLTRLKTELSDSVQRYADLQKKIAERSRALLPPAQKDKKKSPSSEQNQEDPLLLNVAGPEEGAQAFLSEISEEDVEVLHQREEALLQIEVRDSYDTSEAFCSCLPLRAIIS
uniref:t-SNARE domain-containing protein 1-like n=1 Tax=Cyprinodon variegatus TaxID=28743 RepID=A0A3Q2DWB1_CYPVA